MLSDLFYTILKLNQVQKTLISVKLNSHKYLLLYAFENCKTFRARFIANQIAFKGTQRLKHFLRPQIHKNSLTELFHKTKICWVLFIEEHMQRSAS